MYMLRIEHMFNTVGTFVSNLFNYDVVPYYGTFNSCVGKIVFEHPSGIEKRCSKFLNPQDKFCAKFQSKLIGINGYCDVSIHTGSFGT